MSDEFTNISRPKVLYTYIKNVMVNARSLDQVHFKFIAPKDMLAKKNSHFAVLHFCECYSGSTPAIASSS